MSKKEKEVLKQEFYSIAEVAFILNEPELTVRRMIEKKEIDFMEVGKRKFITREILTAYIIKTTKVR